MRLFFRHTKILSCIGIPVESTSERKREVSLWIASLFLLSWLLIISSDATADCEKHELSFPGVKQGYGKSGFTDLEPSTFNSAAGVLKSVYDGDTLTLRDGRKIRLIGINTPEMSRKDRPAEPLAEQATLYLRSLLTVGRTVQLRLGSQRLDSYGRILAHVFTEEGVNVTSEMLEKGYGFQVLIAPNDWAAKCYHRSESVARQKKIGVWADPYFQIREADSGSIRGGFAVISGTVERVSITKRTVWIDIEGDIALNIPRMSWAQFQSIENELVSGQLVEARGWVIDRQMKGKAMKKRYKRWMIMVNHPGSLRF